MSLYPPPPRSSSFLSSFLPRPLTDDESRFALITAGLAVAAAATVAVNRRIIHAVQLLPNRRLRIHLLGTFRNRRIESPLDYWLPSGAIQGPGQVLAHRVRIVNDSGKGWKDYWLMSESNDSRVPAANARLMENLLDQNRLRDTEVNV